MVSLFVRSSVPSQRCKTTVWSSVEITAWIKACVCCAFGSVCLVCMFLYTHWSLCTLTISVQKKHGFFSNAFEFCITTCMCMCVCVHAVWFNFLFIFSNRCTGQLTCQAIPLVSYEWSLHLKMSLKLVQVSVRERERESRDARFIEGRNRQAEYAEFRRIQGFWSATSTLTPDGKM